MANEVIIPYDIKPESGEEVTLLDDQTLTFRPMFGRNWTQRNSFGDPRWQFKRTYKALRMSDRARMGSILGEARGAFRTVMLSPAQEARGTWAAQAGGELFTNSDFSSGTTSWSAGTSTSLSASDGVLRILATSYGANIGVIQNVSLAAYLPFVCRSVVRAGRGFDVLSVGPYLADGSGGVNSNLTTTRGYLTTSGVSRSASAGGSLPALCQNATGMVAGDYFDVLFASLSQCFLVDGAGNLIKDSNSLSTVNWSKATGVTAGNNGTAAPDGTLFAQYLQESDTTNREHYVVQDYTVTSDAQDVAVTISVCASSRSWVVLRLRENTGSTFAYQWFNVTTGVLGSQLLSGGTNWSNIRATITSQGSNWYRCSIVARKTNAATSLSVLLQSATADLSLTYAGTASTVALLFWECTVWPSSTPTRQVTSTSAAVATQTQTGSTIYVKGLPASQAGLLASGDWTEIDGQLKMNSASLDSNAAGLGTLRVRPQVARAVADNTPVIVTKPAGRFMLAQNARWNANFGLYADYDLTFEEVYE